MALAAGSTLMTRRRQRHRTQVWLLVAGVLSCGHSGPPLRATPATPVYAGCSYEVLAGPGGDLLAVEGSFPAGSGENFGVDPEGASFLGQVFAYHDGRTAPVTR